MFSPPPKKKSCVEVLSASECDLAWETGDPIEYIEMTSLAGTLPVQCVLLRRNLDTDMRKTMGKAREEDGHLQAQQ